MRRSRIAGVTLMIPRLSSKDHPCQGIPSNLKARFEDIAAAAYIIKDGVLKTSCDRSHMNTELGMDLFFKKEYMQYTGSFKERGAR